MSSVASIDARRGPGDGRRPSLPSSSRRAEFRDAHLRGAEVSRRVAIVGAGVSGLVCAWLLHDDHDVTVFEAGDWVGGHTHTVDVDSEDGSKLAVDTGFIVFNDRTYPNFIRILERLGVAAQPSEMSFSVHDERNGLEWNGRNLRTIFVQKRNLLRPAFLGMLRDVMRFNREARALAQSPREQSLGDFLDDGKYGRAFRELYVIPMGAAIWSTDPQRMLDFPAHDFARFFENHGMLEIDDRPQWRVVRGGSRTYVQAMTRGFADRIRTRSPVRGIRRDEAHVTVRVDGHEPERFDSVILASHADQSLAMLEDPDPRESSILGAIPFTRNRTTLHTGDMLLPHRRRALASWNYRIDGEQSSRVRLCYHMNTLQSLAAKRDYCVSLNSDDRIDVSHRLGSWDYEHPRFTLEGSAAQGRWGEIDGQRRTHYAGAYWLNGFHEDGVVSALRVCEKFGKEL